MFDRILKVLCRFRAPRQWEGPDKAPSADVLRKGAIMVGSLRYCWESHIEALTQNGVCGDAIWIERRGESVLFCIFDGACGQPLDSMSSATAVRVVESHPSDEFTPGMLQPLLDAIDTAVRVATVDRGLTTAALLLADAQGFWVIAAGDSEVWGAIGGLPLLMSRGHCRRKLGEGYDHSAQLAGPFVGLDLVVAASDGLWHSLWPEQALELMLGGAPPSELAAAIRRKTRQVNLPDDFSAITIRRLDG